MADILHWDVSNSANKQLRTKLSNSAGSLDFVHSSEQMQQTGINIPSRTDLSPVILEIWSIELCGHVWFCSYACIRGCCFIDYVKEFDKEVVSGCVIF